VLRHRADLWRRPPKESSKVAQPSTTELAAWQRLHVLGTEARTRLRPQLGELRVVMPAVPLSDTWIAVNQLRELGIAGDEKREVKREDDLRLFLVAISRCKRDLFLLWNGSEPSEFVRAMRTAIDVRG
jgi:hypothetical protein